MGLKPVLHYSFINIHFSVTIVVIIKYIYPNQQKYMRILLELIIYKLEKLSAAIHDYYR